MNPAVAVVILNYNGKDYLERFLPGVVSMSPEAGVWVVDNASTDHSVAFLQQHHPGVELVQLPENLGYAGGYYEGLKQIPADYYVLLNSDVEVTEGWLPPMIRLLESDPQIAACQPKILSHHLRDTFEYAGAAGGFIDVLAYPFCRGRVFGTLEKDLGQYDDELEIFWATGACLFVRAAAYHHAGGLDPSFFAHFEELDLCWRLKMAGYRIFYQGHSRVYHVGGGTLSSQSPHKTYLNFRNSSLLLLKNEVRKALWWKIPLKFTLDFLVLIGYLLKGEPANAKAIHKAHLYVVRKGKMYSAQQLRSRLSSHTGVYRGLSIMAYLLGNRTYSQLKRRIQ